MRTIDLLDVGANRSLFIALEAAAKRERSRRFGAWLAGHLAAFLTRKHGHAARPHLARQG